MEIFPKAVKATGTEKEFLFLSEERDGNKVRHVMMKTSPGGVVPATETVKKESLFPIYIRLMSTWIFTGRTEKIA